MLQLYEYVRRFNNQGDNIMTTQTHHSDQALKCTSCGADLRAGALFCAQCGQAVESKSPPEMPAKAQRSDTPTEQWEVRISTLKNPLLWFQLVMVSLVSSSYLLLLLVGINLFEGSWEAIPASLSIGLIMAGGFFTALSLVLVLMHGRGVPTKYVLHDDYIEQHTLARGKKTAGLLSLFGVLSGKNAGYTAAGATLLASSREVIAVRWKDATSLKVFPKRNEIQLHNEWRTTMQVVCPGDLFDHILQSIQQHTAKYSTPEKPKGTTEIPFARKVILSLFALIFGLFLFPRLPIHYVGIFAIATILIAFLTLWSSGLKQRIFGGLLLLVPIVSVALAFVFGEVDLSQPGAMYALIIELIILGYFMLLGLGVALKFIR